MRAPALRRWVAALLAPWVVALVLVPGLDGCPLHGLHATATSDVAADQASAHAHQHGATRHDAGQPDDAPSGRSPRCDCLGDCAAAANAVVSAPVTAPQAAYIAAFAPPAQHASWRGVPSRTVRRQPPSNGPPLA